MLQSWQAAQAVIAASLFRVDGTPTDSFSASNGKWFVENIIWSVTSINSKCNPILSSKEGLFRKSTSPIIAPILCIQKPRLFVFVKEKSRVSRVLNTTSLGLNFSCKKAGNWTSGPYSPSWFRFDSAPRFSWKQGVSSSRYTKIYSDCAVRRSRCKRRCCI